MKVFIEEQRFNQWWLFVMLLAPLFILFYSILFGNEELTSENETIVGLIIPLIIMLLVIVLVIGIRLKTRIDEKGIYYQFFPLNLKQKFRSWVDIKSCYVRTYKPIREYGGWGFRLGLGRSYGRALNIRGRKGIQLEFKNGKKLLLGTQKENEVQAILETYKDKINDI